MQLAKQKSLVAHSNTHLTTKALNKSINKLHESNIRLNSTPKATIGTFLDIQSADQKAARTLSVQMLSRISRRSSVAVLTETPVKPETEHIIARLAEKTVTVSAFIQGNSDVSYFNDEQTSTDSVSEEQDELISSHDDSSSTEDINDEIDRLRKLVRNTEKVDVDFLQTQVVPIRTSQLSKAHQFKGKVDRKPKYIITPELTLHVTGERLSFGDQKKDDLYTDKLTSERKSFFRQNLETTQSSLVLNSFFDVCYSHLWKVISDLTDFSLIRNKMT